MDARIKKAALILIVLFGALFALRLVAKNAIGPLNDRYLGRASSQIVDRNGKTMFIRTNQRNDYAIYSDALPVEFTRLIVKKEDRFFWRHFGVNPVSIVKVLAGKIGIYDRAGSSTITQQLAKLLLEQENSRTVRNKLRELYYAFALETGSNKNEILKTYANSIYLGNRIQGLETASRAYFGVTASLLTAEQTLQIIAALSNPGANNPATDNNIALAKTLAANLGITVNDDDFTSQNKASQNLEKFVSFNQPTLELSGYLAKLPEGKTETVTIDRDLNEKTRAIVKKNLDLLATKKAKNAAVVVLGLPGNEILSLVGSPDPASFTGARQINMINEPRQIGSTIKPFIYMKGFEKGMRPYTVIDDREYKFGAAEGFDIYPRNYDRLYHGKMTAHYALANSINVCAVKTLEYVGVNEFGDFLTSQLGYIPVQNLSNYQLGIALGALEMNLLDLSRDFTVFPNGGRLKNLHLFYDASLNAGYFPHQDKEVAKIEYVELVNKILNDRASAQDQFGSQSVLNLPAENYALKTGTSHDYTDSWVIGYTPDFLVGVWVGNADNSATDGLSGQLGAGLIWSEVMQTMLNSPYGKKTAFDFSDLAEYEDNGIQYGLKNDDYDKSKNVIEALDNALILKPHDNDVFLFEKNTQIALRSKTDATWLVDNKQYGTGKQAVFTPPSPGNYRISAESGGRTETVTITVRSAVGTSGAN